MTQQPGRHDFGSLAGTESQTEVDDIAGLDNADIAEGIRDDADDQADAIETVDDLTGSHDFPEPGGPPGLGRDDHK